MFFLYLKVYIFWKFVQYTIHWDKTQMLKKFPLDKVSATKSTLFFLLWAPTHHSFTLNSQFLYELKYMAYLSKTVRGTFHFRVRLGFIKLYSFVQQNAWTLTLKSHNSIQNENNRKATQFCSRLSDF